MPMPYRRALLATAGSMNHVDRSGVAVIAPLHKPLHNIDLVPVHRICSFQGAQVLLTPMCLRTETLYNAVHDGKIIACHFRFELQQKSKFNWCVHIGIRLIPIGNLDTSCVSATDSFNRIYERQFLNIVIDSSHRDTILSCKASNRQRTMAAQRTPDCYPPFLWIHLSTSFPR